MHGNVVCLTSRKNEIISNHSPEEDEATAFIENFYDWAQQQGIDTSTTEFKFNAATILTVIQSLLHERN